MKKALNSILLFVCSIFLTIVWEPFSLYATGDSFDSLNYQLVDYVSPNGTTSYFNTGYQPNQNTSFIGTFSCTTNATGFFFGVTTTVQGSPRSIGFKDGSTSYQIRTMNSNSNVNIGGKFSVNTVFDLDYSTTVASVTDGSTTYTSNTYSYGNYTLGNLYIFALNNNGPTSMNTTGRLYNLEIYESSVLVHHYYPCYRKSDNVVGLFDGVSNVFIAPSNGNMSYGSAVSDNYTITTAVSPSGSGTVSGGGTYASGTTITLTATAYSGYVFSSWSDNDTSNPRSITVNADSTYTAIFEEESTPTPSYTVSLSVSPTGSGTVSGSGSYSSGTSVTISATAGTGYEFVKWSDDSTTNPRTLVVSADVSLTAIFQEQSSTSDPEPDVPSSWVDWTDENDMEYLEAVPVDLSKIYWSGNFERVIDFIQIYSEQLQLNESYNGTMMVSFLGSYYDNTITAITGCNSSSYNYSTSTQTQVDVTTITPAIYGQFDSNINSDEGIIFDFGISLNGSSSSQITANTSGFGNTTEACRLIGMNDGDGSIDGTTLLAAGYQKKTITYNDGSSSGHTATFYVPGEESLEFAADMDWLESFFDSLYLNVVNNTKIIQHDEFTIRYHGKDGYLMPEYGHIHSDTFIGVLFSALDLNSDHPFLYKTEDRFTLIPQEETYASFNPTFSYHITDNIYDRNYVDLYWQGTRNPVWKFKTAPEEGYLLNGVIRDYYPFYNDYGGYISSTAEAYTIKNTDLSINSNLTAGAVLKVGFASVNLYNYKNNSILNRFNQLGSFLNGWFTRIYQSIGNITGGNESNEIINNVVNDYDISVETDFNGLLQNVNNKREDIDLTLPEFNIPSSDLDGVEMMAQPFSEVFDVYIDNGLGIFIFVPLLLLVLRLIL